MDDTNNKLNIMTYRIIIAICIGILMTSAVGFKRDPPSSPMVILPNHAPYIVVQQPKNDKMRVSTIRDSFTQFSHPNLGKDTIAFLAHSWLAGKDIAKLKVGDKIGIRTGTPRQGGSRGYTVKEIRYYQAIDPQSTVTPLLNLMTNTLDSAQTVFKEIYEGDSKRLVFATCIEKDNSPNWGRMFIIAE